MPQKGARGRQKEVNERVLRGDSYSQLLTLNFISQVKPHRHKALSLQRAKGVLTAMTPRGKRKRTEEIREFKIGNEAQGIDLPALSKASELPHQI